VGYEKEVRPNPTAVANMAEVLATRSEMSAFGRGLLAPPLCDVVVVGAELDVSGEVAVVGTELVWDVNAVEVEVEVEVPELPVFPCALNL